MTFNTFRALALAFAMGLACFGRAHAEETCGMPSGKDDGWAQSSPAAVGINPDALCRLTRRLVDWKETNVHAVLVARHGKLIYEQYFRGLDSQWGQPPAEVDFGPTVPHDLRSITKSVFALLVGIAVDKGWIPAIDQPILPLLPRYADLRRPEIDPITLRDLLTMSAGFAWNEQLPYADPANSETRMDAAADPCRFVLEQPIAHAPGTVWTYSGGSAALLACILHAATGKTIDVLAEENLFGPLGITSAEWARYPKTGEPVAASGLRLLPSDTLKIGQLVLDKGSWRGRQVVPASWVAEATAPQINGPGSLFYGFQFWLGRSLVGHREVDWASGVGYGGQRLYIVPSLDLTVLVQAGLYASPTQDWLGEVILNSFILPAVKP